MKEEYKKYLPVIGLVVCGGLLLIIIINNYSGSITEDGSGKKYQKSLSLDKLYDEAGGNDPLSDSIMTNQTDLSTEKYSCSFMTTYKGIKDRSVKCMKGCNDDEDDENSNFCKQFEYPGGDDKLKDVFLDQTYTRRRGSRKIEATEESTGNSCHNYPLRGDGTGNEIMKCNKGSDRATAECLGEPFDGTDQNYSNNCFGYDSSEKKFYNCKTESDGSGNKILVQGEECDYKSECDKMIPEEGESLGWVLETKRYMNEIRGECKDEIKTGRGVEEDAAVAESEKDSLKVFKVLNIITLVIIILIMLLGSAYLIWKEQLAAAVGLIIFSVFYLASSLGTLIAPGVSENKSFHITMTIFNSISIMISLIIYKYFTISTTSSEVASP
jgi:hypothetical protein